MSSVAGAIPFGQALRFWLKLGFISFGGPAGQIAIMHAELVERRRWISEQRFLHALNYCMLLPGPEAQQLATYIGWLMHRTWGGIVAGVLFVLPSLLVLIGLSWVYLRFGDVPVVAGAFYGLKPAVTALVVHAAHRIGTRALKNRLMWAIAACSFIALSAFDTPFPAIVIAAALVGWVCSKRWPGLFGARSADAVHRTTAETRPEATPETTPPAPPGTAAPPYAPPSTFIIDDHTPTPAHARFNSWGLARVLVIGLGLWLLAMGLLVAAVGWQGTLTQMAWFFTKAALLTFGGAYAVLPYVFQGAVDTHQWLTAAQMIDGLALGETTPGPLIMVVAFVGFVGGWTHQVLGPESPFWGAALAASVVTFFTFLPSFVFILAGGPLVEATHGRLGFTAPLAAITAAVVGVILNLALFFAAHVLWPQGLHAAIDATALFIGVAAAVALFRYRVGVLPLLAVCAAFGVVLQFAGATVAP